MGFGYDNVSIWKSRTTAEPILRSPSSNSSWSLTSIEAVIQKVENDAVVPGLLHPELPVIDIQYVFNE
jgi:hypothetical protein